MPGILKAIQKDDEELREGSLQALEALLLRCPTEITPYLSSITQAGNQFIKYDPVCITPRYLSPFDLNLSIQNYAGGDDEDEEMADADEDDDDDEADE